MLVWHTGMRDFDPKPGCKRLDNILLMWSSVWMDGCVPGGRRAAMGHSYLVREVLTEITAPSPTCFGK